MDNQDTIFITQEEGVDSDQKSSIKTTGFSDISGKVTDILGTGDNAKNSLIYLTIKWSFWGGIVISTFIIANCWLFRENEKVPDITGDLISWWQVLLPLITLALGYAFGKNETSR